MKVSAIKGFSDVLPGATETWQFIEEKAREVFNVYNFSEIRIPLLEKTELFTRSLGETTDIVEKEMYTFADRDSKGSLLTLRPEGTAGVVRAYIESEMYKIEPARKLYYMGPMFRRERPQKGRLRQFHQIGAEALGRADPFIDAEMLLLLHDFFRSTGIRDVSLQLNSLGCVQCRPAYRDQLLAFLKSKEATLCANCRRRMERNPLRVLDCKEPGCIAATQRAPSILQALCSACRDHFEAVQFSLRQAEIAYALNPRMVRGLDYYCRTTFEWTSNQLGAQNAVAAGGRYDGLVEDLGGPLIPGIGFAAGIERLALLLGVGGPSPGQAPDVYLVWVGPQARSWSFPVVHELRQNGIVVEIEGEEKSLKSQMRRADKLKAGLVVIVGEDELRKNAVVVRDMAAKQQIEVPFDRLKAELISRKERR